MGDEIIIIYNIESTFNTIYDSFIIKYTNGWPDDRFKCRQSTEFCIFSRVLFYRYIYSLFDEANKFIFVGHAIIVLSRILYNNF